MSIFRENATLLDRFAANLLQDRLENITNSFRTNNGFAPILPPLLPPINPGERPVLPRELLNQDNFLSGAIDDLMRDMFGLPPSNRSTDGDETLEYTAPDGTKVKVNIDRPEKKDEPASCCGGKKSEDKNDKPESWMDGVEKSIEETVNDMLEDLGFDVDDNKQEGLEQYLSNYLEDELTNQVVENMMGSLFGDISGTDLQPWSPWGMNYPLFSGWNPYLSLRTFPMAYLYGQLAGNFALSNTVNQVYNPYQRYMGGWSR